MAVAVVLELLHALIAWPHVELKIPFELPCEIRKEVITPPNRRSVSLKIYGSCRSALYSGSLSLRVEGELVDEVMFPVIDPFWLTMRLGRKRRFINYRLVSGSEGPLILRMGPPAGKKATLEIRLSPVLDSDSQRELETKVRAQAKHFELVWTKAFGPFPLFWG